jgi:hypothetical protein
MAAGYSAFMTYMLLSESGKTNGYGYSDAIHCNYIRRINFDTLTNKEFNIYFESDKIDEFKFMSVSGGTGFTAHKIWVLVQLINNEPYDSLNDVRPFSQDWVYFDVTDQVTGYTTGSTFILTPQKLTSDVFRIPISRYNLAKQNQKYNLDYLNYPSSSGSTGVPPLCFGDESYFIGNVTTSVEAIVFSTELAINLP